MNTLTFDNPTPAYNSNAPTREELARSDSARSNSEMFAEPPSHSDKREATIAAVKPISRREIGRDPTQVLGGRIEPITHVVRRGENFWTIARHYYGSGRFYRALWKANAERVPKIDEIYVGTPILVPAPEDLDRAYIDPPTPTRTGARQPDAAPRKAALGDSTKDALVDDRAVRVSAESELLFESRGTTMDNHPSNAESSTTGANAPSHAKPRRNRVYIVKPYDTLRSVAAKELGDAHREDELLRLNEDVVDDPYDLPAGTAIRLPWDEPR